MDRSGGISLFGMGHMARPGVHNKSSVLQSMLGFAIESKEQGEGRNRTKTHACCGASVCERTCAWWLAVLHEATCYPGENGQNYSRLHLVASWQKEINGQMTGHPER